MSVQECRKYDSDLKRNAVQLTEEQGRTVAEIALNQARAYLSCNSRMLRGRSERFLTMLKSPFQYELEWWDNRKAA